jgi:hypothetical protein
VSGDAFFKLTVCVLLAAFLLALELMLMGL